MNEPALGERLRRAREAIPASLHQAARETRIRADYLEAMERGSFRFIVGKVYVRGMVQSYARWLGLDPEEVAAEFDRAAGHEQAPPLADAFNRPTWRLERPRRPHWAIGAALAVMILAGLSLVGLMRPADVAAPPSRPPNPLQQAATPSPPGSSVLAQAPPAAAQGVQLVVEVVGARCWLLVSADGHDVFQGTLTNGASRTFEARDTLSVLFGNLGAVRLRMNGRDLGTPGLPGQVLRVNFTPESTSLGG